MAKLLYIHPYTKLVELLVAPQSLLLVIMVKWGKIDMKLRSSRISFSHFQKFENVNFFSLLYKMMSSENKMINAKMTVIQLKAAAKAQGSKGYSKLRK